MFKSSMIAVHSSLRQFAGDNRGATSIEYALIASGISIVIVATVVSLGSNLQNLYTSVATAMK